MTSGATIGIDGWDLKLQKTILNLNHWIKKKKKKSEKVKKVIKKLWDGEDELHGEIAISNYTGSQF